MLRAVVIAVALTFVAAAATPPALADEHHRRPGKPAKQRHLTPEQKRNRAEAQRVAAAIQSYYRKADHVRARFDHTIVLAKTASKKVRRGRLAFERPGRVSVRYDQPKGHRVISDGERVRVYDPDAKTLYVTKIDRSLYPAVVAFLRGDAVLSRDYRLRVLDLGRAHVKKGRVIEAIPKEPTPVMTRMLLFVGDGRGDRYGEVERILVVDAQGNHNRFDFHELKRGKDIPNREFTFRPPRGTHVIRP